MDTAEDTSTSQRFTTRRRLAEVAKISAIAAVTIAAAITAVELWLRLAPPDKWRLDQLLTGGATSDRLVEPHPYLTYALTPSFDKDGVRHNSSGYRSGEIAAARTPGSVRILCVGGSSTYGVGAVDPYTWPAQLQIALADNHPSTAFEVINAGVPGYTSFESLIDFELRGADTQPDVVIVYQAFNDLRAGTRAGDRVAGDNRHYRKRWTAPGDDANGVLKYSRAALLWRYLFTAFPSRAADLAEYVVVDSSSKQFVRPLSDVAIASYRRNMMHIVSAARTAGARVLLVTEAYGEATIHPDEADIVDDGMAAFAEIIREIVSGRNDQGTALLDGRKVLPAFDDVFAEIDHLSARGAVVLGLLVRARLEELRWAGR